MTTNHDYSFRNREFCRVPPLKPTPNACGNAECIIDESWEIIVPRSDSRLVRYYTEDLCRFFGDAFGVFLRIRWVQDIKPYLDKPEKYILLTEEKDMPESPLSSETAGTFRAVITKSYVLITGKTERGTAKGVYYLEDSMRLRGECGLIPEDKEHAPLFFPRMTHSGTELDTFSDNFLEAAAHAGMDAIIVYAGHPDSHLHGFKDPDPLWPGACRGYCDYSHLVWRAAGYGLDVYVYSHLLCDVHPDEPEAEAYYQASFGKLFASCPGIRGLILVGETFEFPSKDPHTSGIRCQLQSPDDPRPSPGWYPCSDYPRLLTMVQNTIRPYNPDADIVFWSYNWGGADKEARLSLIENLPKGITMLVTFEMWQTFTDENGQTHAIDDYSIAFPGPADVFRDEAEKAKELGIRLYSMANTGGRTWDNGVCPYLPAPQQWQKRYEALCQAHGTYGLCGLMENHHYGWLPSFLSLFSKNAFTTNGMSNDEMLLQIARRDYGEYGASAVRAWEAFSEGMSNVVASGFEQYGPYRCGPTYPLLFDQTDNDLEVPSVPWAWHDGASIWYPVYMDPVFPHYQPILMRHSHVKKVVSCFAEGLVLLEDAAEKLGVTSGSEIASQIAVARFLYCSFLTAEHVMEWQMAKKLLMTDKQDIPDGAWDTIGERLGITDCTADELAVYMRRIAEAETENVAAALECWREDSSIGFEASMEYVFNDVFAAWKNNETERSLIRLAEFLRRR
ncbi:MAG: hypothetical protein E7658_08295 [Ruminococcaceae bacterium]|nr:hypothetical protein [Oscillospiraceae bacterium]